MENTKIYPIPFNSAGIENEKFLRIIDDPKEELKGIFGNKYSMHLQNLKTYGQKLVRGCYYDFMQYLNKYLYKQNGEWRECYAPSKALLRKSTYGKIDEIILLKKGDK